MKNKSAKIESFEFSSSYILSKKYKVKHKLGGGWEGEVFIIEELATGIERAAKFFFPHRNVKNKAAVFYAKKLHKLRSCSILIQYLTQDVFRYRGQDVRYLISEYVEGVPLKQFLKSQRGGRLSAFQALHLLYALVKGIEDIHRLREYHGDLHAENIIVQRYGLGFDLKLVDMFHWGRATPQTLREDVFDLIRIFYDSLGGARHYASQTQEVKEICCGLKRSLIEKKFKTSGELREYLETMQWS